MSSSSLTAAFSFFTIFLSTYCGLTAPEARSSFILKASIMGIIWLLFVIYIPIGLPLADYEYIKVGFEPSVARDAWVGGNDDLT